MLRALIVDDSPTARELLEAILKRDSGIRVVGLAKDGVEAVEMVRELKPDVVTMDIHMPRMDGFEATREIMATVPTPVVIVTGSTNVADVERSMQALRAGALAAIEKPPGPVAVHHDEAARNLIETVKAMSQVKVVKRRRLEIPNKVAAFALERRVGQPQIVAIAASTGGPQAVQRLLAELAAGFPLPILVVQHLSPGFTAGFVTWLSATIQLPVKLPAADDALEAGTVYFAPENRHLGVSNSGRIVLSDDPPIGGFRPAATFMFDSVARAFGPSVVALILTGMGKDGLEGLRSVRNAGGLVMAQDEASCVVFGMPRAAIEAGLADIVLPLEGMADELIACVSRSRM